MRRISLILDSKDWFLNKYFYWKTGRDSGAPEQAPRWDLMDTEGCGGGIRFLAPSLIVWGYVGIYRRKECVGGATRGP